MPTLGDLRGSALRLLQANPQLAGVADRCLVALRNVRKHAFAVVDRETDRKKLMINLGGGAYFRRHWRVLDFPSDHYRFATGVVDYPIDLTSDRSFTLESESVSFYFCSHTLEHLPQEHVGHVLGEVWRTLKPGGAARFTMPDYDLAYRALVEGKEELLAKFPGGCIEERFLDFVATYWKGKIPPAEVRKDLARMTQRELADHYTLRVPRESQREATGNHINWWTHEKLAEVLRAAGFATVYRSGPQQSRFPEMRGLGRNTGFDSTHPEISLFVEAVK